MPTAHLREVQAAIRNHGRPAPKPVSMEGREAVKIPFEAADARSLAKRRGARWLGEQKAWAVPTEHVAEIRLAIAEDPGMVDVCVGEPCNCGGMQIWEGECLVTGRSSY